MHIVQMLLVQIEWIYGLFRQLGCQWTDNLSVMC